MRNDERHRRDGAAEDRVYVLRVRSPQDAEPGQDGAWCASVREGVNGHRRHFLSVDDCIEHLYSELLRR